MHRLDLPSILRSGLFRIALLAAIPLAAALLAGLVSAIIQTITSVQEQSLAFIPKLLAVLLILAIAGGWMLENLGDYTKQLFALIPQAAR